MNKGIKKCILKRQNTYVHTCLFIICIIACSLLALAADGNRRTADVRCKGFTNLFTLSKHDFEAAMKDYPEAHKLLKKRAK